MKTSIRNIQNRLKTVGIRSIQSAVTLQTTLIGTPPTHWNYSEKEAFRISLSIPYFDYLHPSQPVVGQQPPPCPP
jgi:hypothetical protein